MKAVLIYEKPKDLFFPLYQTVFSPFSGPVGTPLYALYRILNTIGGKAGSFYWGSWKKDQPDADLFILFDYGYQRGMECYLKNQYPGKRVVLFCWNKIDNVHNNFRKFTDPDSIYSTDPDDCRMHGLHFQTLFYPAELACPYGGEKNKVLFVGADKGRYPYLKILKKTLEDAGLTMTLKVLPDKTTTEIASCDRMREPLPYTAYLKLTEDADVLLDIVQKGQAGLTLRVMEAVFRSKKLITNNPAVLSIEGIPKDNLFLLPPDAAAIDKNQLERFAMRPFIPYPKELTQHYCYEAWLSRFF